MPLLAAHNRTSRDEPYHFAGRREELAMLHECLDEVTETSESLRGMALVTGVPGVGKTQRGVLAENEDGTVGFGIPSFFAYMGEQIKERDQRTLLSR